MMTKEDWAYVKANVRQFSSVKLDCDGYLLDILETRVKNSIKVSFYVNGYLKGVWASGDCPERQKFFRRVEKCLWSAQRRKDSRRTLGAKLYKTLDMDKKYEYYTAFWPSIGAFISHLKKNCENITLIKPE